jgi:pimeloyl-ACP methyl ester carboxylesterase
VFPGTRRAPHRVPRRSHWPLSVPLPSWRSRRALLIGATMLLAAGCADDGQPQLRWFPCSLYTNQDDGRAECAEARQPLFYDQAGGETTPVYVKRLRSQGASTRQLWLLHGGPGPSGVDDFGPWMDFLADLRSDLDVYTLDHRGAGRSNRLGCPEQEALGSDGGSGITDAEMDACIAYLRTAWGRSLEGITVTASARDVGELITLTRKAGQRVFVLGTSYGTYLAHRYMQLFPQQADGVILEAVTAPNASSVTYDHNFDLNARKLFDHCSQDARCSSKLGPDPWSVAGAVGRRLAEGHCAELGMTASLYRRLLAAMVQVSWGRGLAPAIVYRLGRCHADDVEALRHLLDALVAPDTGTTGRSALLGYHITLSELWDNDDPPSLEELQAATARTTVSHELGPRYGALYDHWPRYPRDQYDDAFAAYGGPLLMLQGSFDPATPIEEAAVMQSAFNGPLQSFVVFPQAAHDVLGSTPAYGGDRDCGYEILLAFLDDPNRVPDSDCTRHLDAIDFDGEPQDVEYLFGTTDTWGDGDLPAGRAAAPGEPRSLRSRLLPPLADRAAPTRPGRSNIVAIASYSTETMRTRSSSAPMKPPM